MRSVLLAAERVAATDLPVLILGEQGTGKERLAHMIHGMSPRAAKVIHTVDCSAFSIEQQELELFGCEIISWQGLDIQRGAFELATEGTVLLDELQALNVPLQMRILRSLELGQIYRVGSEAHVPINTRMIATVTPDRSAKTADRVQIEEVFRRLGPIVIEIPPLRERKEDIPELLRLFVEDARAKSKTPVGEVSEEAVELCLRYDWPGNVQHLRNAVEYACVMSQGGTIFPSHFPGYLAKVI